MARALDIVIAGAGAVGSTSALVLARAGHRVTVVDPAKIGANASGVAAGMLAPAFETLFDGGSDDDFARLREAQDLWPPLAGGIGLPLQKAGALAVGARGQAEAWAARLRALDIIAAVTAPARTAALAPLLAPGLWGLLCRADWRLDASLGLAALRGAAEALGARFVAASVAAFAPGSARLGDGARLPADRLVVATGASTSLAETAPELAVLTPVKGHILRGPPGQPGPVIRAPGVYVCVDQSQTLLGASMEIGERDAGVDPAVVADLKARGAAIAPALAGLDWRPSTGVRAATPDGWPLAGASAAPGVILAVGARRNGWLLAPMIAEAVLAAVETRAAEGPARRFDPARLSRG